MNDYETEAEAIEAWNNRATEAEIRNKSINEFIRKLKTHPHAQYHLDKYLLEDIYEIAEQLKEE